MFILFQWGIFMFQPLVFGVYSYPHGGLSAKNIPAKQIQVCVEEMFCVFNLHLQMDGEQIPFLCQNVCQTHPGSPAVKECTQRSSCISGKIVATFLASGNQGIRWRHPRGEKSTLAGEPGNPGKLRMGPSKLEKYGMSLNKWVFGVVGIFGLPSWPQKTN